MAQTADARRRQSPVEDGLGGAYFVGPHGQPALAELYNVADVGVFPTKLEAFGLVYLECMACGTPVIGTAAGGPLEFVDERVGELVTDHESNEAFSVALAETVARALTEDWKSNKGGAAVALARLRQLRPDREAN